MKRKFRAYSPHRGTQTKDLSSYRLHFEPEINDGEKIGTGPGDELTGDEFTGDEFNCKKKVVEEKGEHEKSSLDEDPVRFGDWSVKGRCIDF